MSSVAIPGVINMRGAKPARPKKSSKNFNWPSYTKVTPEQKKRFAVFLESKMSATKHTHISLARYLWGSTTAGGTAGTTVSKWLRMQKFPNRATADHLAAYFKVSAEEMLRASGEYKDPSHLIVTKAGTAPWGAGKPKGKSKVAAVKLKPPQKKPNGHAVAPDDDPRWLLPAGAEPPQVKLETSKTRPMWNIIEVKAEVPPEVALSVYSLLNQYRVENPES